MTIKKILWASLSYPLSLLMVFMPVVFPLEGLADILYLLALDSIWIILALWFGCACFMYARGRDVRGWLMLVMANGISLGIMFFIMTMPWMRHLDMTVIIAGDAYFSARWFALFPSVLCLVVFSALGFTCKQTDGVDDLP